MHFRSVRELTDPAYHGLMTHKREMKTESLSMRCALMLGFLIGFARPLLCIGAKAWNPGCFTLPRATLPTRRVIPSIPLPPPR